MKSKLFLLAWLLVIFGAADSARSQSQFGNGITFKTSGQYVSVANFGGIAPTNEVTVEFWVNVTDNSVNFSTAFSLVPDQYPTNRFSAILDYADGDCYWEFGNVNSGGLIANTVPGYLVGNWTHFAFVASQSGNSMTIYTNGNIFATATGRSFFTRGTFELRLGAFNGAVNDFRVWNVARSQAQIQASYASPLAGNESGLVLYYRLNSTNGTIVTNSATATGATYNGTLVGSPAWGSLPYSATASASNRTGNSVTLNGTIYPGTNSAKYFFQYGTTTNYSSVSSIGTVTTSNFFTSIAVSNAITGLSSATLYHFRIVGTNSGGTNAGLDQTFILGGGTWTQVATNPPYNGGHLLLLTDGTVISSDEGSRWSRLSPDLNGGYVYGTWTNTANMSGNHTDFASQVLTNGLVMVAGGEYGAGADTNSEVYNPVSNTWTRIKVPAGLLSPGTQTNNGQVSNNGFRDPNSMLRPDGTMMVAPIYPAVNNQTLIYNPATTNWSAGPVTLGGQDEASWVKLADGSILTIDINSTNSERYIPSLNAWVADANVPVQLYDPYGEELGPAMLLPNGKAIFFGSLSNTAIYTPSGNNSPGSWAVGPNFPNGQGMPDAPAAMMANGKILCAVSPTPTAANHFPNPVTFYEYDYVNTNFTLVNAPGGDTSFPGPAYPMTMLDLPDGSVLLAYRGQSLYVYTPTNFTPLASGQPSIYSISQNGDGSLHLTGTLFNGISAGAAYGDDEQMDSNYPLVRFTDASGNIRYGRTYNWNNTGVMTGSTIVRTECTIPPGASLNDSIQVVANGNASPRVPLNALNYEQNGITWVDFSYNAGGYNGTFATPFRTMATGVSGATSGGLVVIKTSSSGETLKITKPMRIISYNGTAHIGP